MLLAGFCDPHQGLDGKRQDPKIESHSYLESNLVLDCLGFGCESSRTHRGTQESRRVQTSFKKGWTQRAGRTKVSKRLRLNWSFYCSWEKHIVPVNCCTLAFFGTTSSLQELLEGSSSFYFLCDLMLPRRIECLRLRVFRLPFFALCFERPVLL